MDRGFLPLFRKIKENPVWEDNELLAIWVRLLFRANYMDKRWFDGNKFITIKRGSFSTSQPHLAEYLKLPKTTMLRRLAMFENEGMLDIKVDNKYTIITICNYDKYYDAYKNGGQECGLQVDSKWTDGGHNRSKEIKEIKENRYTQEVAEIIGDLNTKLGTNFTTTRIETIKNISARLKEGFTVEQFKKVHTVKIRDWKNDPMMSKHLNPSTLYRPSNFEKYVNQQDSDSVRDPLKETIAMENRYGKDGLNE